jgi:hypothetical protein
MVIDSPAFGLAFARMLDNTNNHIQRHYLSYMVSNGWEHWEQPLGRAGGMRDAQDGGEEGDGPPNLLAIADSADLDETSDEVDDRDDFRFQWCWARHISSLNWSEDVLQRPTVFSSRQVKQAILLQAHADTSAARFELECRYRCFEGGFPDWGREPNIPMDCLLCVAELHAWWSELGRSGPELELAGV